MHHPYAWCTAPMRRCMMATNVHRVMFLLYKGCPDHGRGDGRGEDGNRRKGKGCAFDTLAALVAFVAFVALIPLIPLIALVALVAVVTAAAAASAGFPAYGAHAWYRAPGVPLRLRCVLPCIATTKCTRPSQTRLHHRSACMCCVLCAVFIDNRGRGCHRDVRPVRLPPLAGELVRASHTVNMPICQRCRMTRKLTVTDFAHAIA